MVVDTSALVTVQLQEPGWEELFVKIAAADVALVGTPTLLETAMVMNARIGPGAQALLADAVRELSVDIVPFTENHYHAAINAFLRYGKGRHPAALNFGDCMAYALASVARLPLLYVGKDFARTDIAAA